MKKSINNKGSVPPWEDQPEEPQRITAKEASAAAAVIPGASTAGSGSPDGRASSAKGSSTAREASSVKGSGRQRWQPSLFGYGWVMRNIGFLVFLAMLAIVYIYNGHYADKISRDINRTSKELKELQYEYKTLKSEVMFRSKQSELARAVEPFGLKELTQPPFVLIDSVRK